jgi:hypothetical protein
MQLITNNSEGARKPPMGRKENELGKPRMLRAEPGRGKERGWTQDISPTLKDAKVKLTLPRKSAQACSSRIRVPGALAPSAVAQIPFSKLFVDRVLSLIT